MNRASQTLIVLAGLVLSACSFDHRKEIAYQTLFSDDGWPNAEAFTHAMSARFPLGTSAKALQSFAMKAGGSCRYPSDSTLKCEIPTRGKFCAVSVLIVSAKLESEAIQSLQVVATGGGC